MKIWLDDQLNDPDPDLKDRWTPDDWFGARNFKEFKALIEQVKASGEPIEAIDFDNDLGKDAVGELEMEGRDILQWLADNYPEYVVGEGIELKSHSKNLEAKEKIEQKIAFWLNQILSAGQDHTF